MNKYCIVLGVGILLFALGCITPNIQNIEGNDINVTYFYSINCPACSKTTPFLIELQKDLNFSLDIYEISSFNNSQKFKGFLNDYNVPLEMSGFVPTTFVNNHYIIGADLNKIKYLIDLYIQRND